MTRILATYFTRMEDGWYNRRMQLEIERSRAISDKRKVAGRKGFQAKAKHLPSKSSASAEQVPLTPTTTITPTTTPTLEPEIQSQERGGVPPPAPPEKPRRKAKAKDEATRLPPGWDLPDEWRDKAVKAHHADPQQIYRISLDFRDYWHAKAGPDARKLDWEATWRRWVRRELDHA